VGRPGLSRQPLRRELSWHRYRQVRRCRRAVPADAVCSLSIKFAESCCGFLKCLYGEYRSAQLCVARSFRRTLASQVGLPSRPLRSSIVAMMNRPFCCGLLLLDCH
jgi:hypothetical protein